MPLILISEMELMAPWSPINPKSWRMEGRVAPNGNWNTRWQMTDSSRRSRRGGNLILKGRASSGQIAGQECSQIWICRRPRAKLIELESAKIPWGNSLTRRLWPTRALSNSWTTLPPGNRESRRNTVTKIWPLQKRHLTNLRSPLNLRIYPLVKTKGNHQPNPAKIPTKLQLLIKI